MSAADELARARREAGRPGLARATALARQDERTADEQAELDAWRAAEIARKEQAAEAARQEDTDVDRE